MKIYDQQWLESLEEKKAGHMWTVSKGFANFIAKGDGLANSRDVNPLETIWTPQNTGRAKRVTTFRVEKCFFRHTLGAGTFYTSPLRKCQKTQRKTFWLLIFQILNVK